MPVQPLAVAEVDQLPAAAETGPGSEGSLRKQSSVDDAASAAAASGIEPVIVGNASGGGGTTPASATGANNWRLSPAGGTKLECNANSGPGEK